MEASDLHRRHDDRVDKILFSLTAKEPNLFGLMLIAFVCGLCVGSALMMVLLK